MENEYEDVLLKDKVIQGVSVIYIGILTFQSNMHVWIDKVCFKLSFELQGKRSSCCRNLHISIVCRIL